MMQTLQDVAAGLSQALSQGQTPEADNRLTLGALRRQLSDWLATLEEEFAACPGERDAAHWNLVMADRNPTVRATFVALVRTPDAVRVRVGHGEPYAVRRFCEHEFSGAPETVFSELENRFPFSPATVEVPLALLKRWVTPQV